MVCIWWKSESSWFYVGENDLTTVFFTVFLNNLSPGLPVPKGWGSTCNAY